MTKMTTLAIAIGTLALGGCGSAQLLRGHENGGQVSLAGGYMPAMAKARMVMLDHCGGRFSHIERGETVDFTCSTSSQPVFASTQTATSGL
ncbi:MAG: hypothetical protein OXU20_05575 [Myxococcales bacterium]|nr:hypothetical protein [Myxococcales bacterium]MDD9965637.1 hypothetical protein [Myxococcales bacterium]